MALRMIGIGKTKAGRISVDVADLIKDALILPGTSSACQKNKKLQNKEIFFGGGGQQCLQAFTDLTCLWSLC